MGSIKLAERLKGLKAVPGTQADEIKTLEQFGLKAITLDGARIQTGPRARDQLLHSGKLINLEEDPKMSSSFRFITSTCTNKSPHCVNPNTHKALLELGKAFNDRFPGQKLDITSSFRTPKEQKNAGPNKANGTSAHSFAAAIDMRVPKDPQQLKWLKDYFLAMEKIGYGHATLEQHATKCFHVVIFTAPRGIQNRSQDRQPSKPSRSIDTRRLAQKEVTSPSRSRSFSPEEERAFLDIKSGKKTVALHEVNEALPKVKARLNYFIGKGEIPTVTSKNLLTCFKVNADTEPFKIKQNKTLDQQTARVLKSFQKCLGIPATGCLDSRTLRALFSFKSIRA
jgi:hypothetical protein